MIVLVSPRPGGSNPYIDLLYAGVSKLGIDVKQLSTQNAKARCDLCHVHWPDLVLSRKSIGSSFNRAIRLLGLLFWVKLRWGAKVVWTVHNLEPHGRELPLWWRRLFYRIWFSFVDGCIFMSEVSRSEFEAKYHRSFPYAIIPHGHYCDVYDSVKPEAGWRVRLGIKTGDVVFGHYGLIRDYKNVPHLMREFSKLEGEHYKLIVAGKVRKCDAAILKEIEEAVARDPRIQYVQGFVTDEAMKALYDLTHWAVLPYRDIHNSGSALLALSLGCRVLVPDLATMRELKENVRPDCVALISEKGLLASLRACSGAPLIQCQREDLHKLDWPKLRADLQAFYKSMCARK